jgi:heme/copper-type cytochrome/quinol oxidase subunit 3
MISSIRKKHRIVWVFLTVVLAITFVLSIIYRHSEPINEKIPQVKIK